MACFKCLYLHLFHKSWSLLTLLSVFCLWIFSPHSQQGLAFCLSISLSDCLSRGGVGLPLFVLYTPRGPPTPDIFRVPHLPPYWLTDLTLALPRNRLLLFYLSCPSEHFPRYRFYFVPPRCCLEPHCLFALCFIIAISPAHIRGKKYP